jgi:beta-phosphoglucomutase
MTSHLPNNPPRRMLIMDLDGVLVDTEPLNFECWNSAFEQILGFRIEGVHTQLVGLTLDEIYALWMRSCPDPDLRLDTTLRGRLLARKTELFLELGVDRLTPMPGSIELVRVAREGGWYTALASRSLRRRLHKTLEFAHIPALFDVMLGGEDIVDPDTDRKIHSRAAHVFGIAPADCLVVEDSISGIIDALAAGIGTVIGLTTSLDRAALQTAGAHRVIDRLSDIHLPALREEAAPSSL